jgi:hypothetical protein
VNPILDEKGKRMSEIPEKAKPKKVRTSIAAEATRRRDQLQRMKEAEQHRQQVFREERARLALILAEVEVQERSDRRKKELSEQHHVCFLLGGLVLEAIRETGIAKFAVGRAALDQLKPDKFALLELVVQRQRTPSVAGGTHINSLDGSPPLPPDIAL